MSETASMETHSNRRIILVLLKVSSISTVMISIFGRTFWISRHHCDRRARIGSSCNSEHSIVRRSECSSSGYDTTSGGQHASNLH